MRLQRFGSVRTRRPRSIRRATAGLLGAVIVGSLAGTALVATPARAATVSVISDDFEDGTAQGWVSRGGTEVVANSTVVAHGGTHSLLASGRTSSWRGPALDMLSTMTKGTAYTLDVWVRLASGAGTQQLRLSVERRLSGTASYDTVVGNTNVSDSGWTELTGTYLLGYDVDFLQVYVESASALNDFYIDDFSASYTPTLPVQTDLRNLKDVFSPWLVGAAVEPAQLTGDHATLLAKHFNSVTPGNAMKWDATEPTEGTFNFGTADSIVSFAQTNGIQVYGHTLVWGNQTPAWVFQETSGASMSATDADKALLRTRMQNHITTEMQHFAGKVYAWDVVNEAIDENQSDGFKRNSWYNILGAEYVLDAFQYAHAADPTVKLCINDYNTTVAAKRTALYNEIVALKAAGAQVDCVGHQMHSNIQWPSASDLDTTLTQFAQLGIQQRITEMDVSVYTNNTDSLTTIPSSLLTQQATEYANLFTVMLKHKADIASVTFWGLADDATWLDTYPISRLDEPLLFDQQLQAKPAYTSLVALVPVGSTTTTTTKPVTTTTTTTSTTTTKPVTTTTSTTTTKPVTTTTTTAGGKTCTASYAISGSWPGGFQGTVTVKASSAAISGWTVTRTFANGQTVTQAWGATVTTSGSSVTATNMSWNGSLAASGSTSFGFLGTWNGSNAAPTPTCTAA